MEKSEFGRYFADKNKIYYGHGIGNEVNGVIESILKYGLRCSHDNLEYTTVPLGVGDENLFEDIQEKLNNWEHLDSKKIVVASLPIEWHLMNVGTLYGKRQAAFYNYVSEEEAQNIRNEFDGSEKFWISKGYFLKPEFIAGVYDAENQSFAPNERYYENLPEEEKNEILESVKSNYIATLREAGWTCKEFSEVAKDMHWRIPLTQEEIEKSDKEFGEERPSVNTQESPKTNSEELKKEVIKPISKEELTFDDDDEIVW